MLLLTGPPGSGKTHLILDQVRTALASGAADFRVLVPTATMAEHLRNSLAREGFLIRPALITTLSRFVQDFVPDVPELSAVQLELIVGRVLEQDCPPEFAGVASRPGFRALACRLIDELCSAGHDSRRVAKLLGNQPPDAPLAPAFLGLFERVEKELCLEQGLLRPLRLRRAADEIRSRGLGRIRTVFLDGFFTLSNPELYLLHAIRAHTDITVALPDWRGADPARSALRSMGLDEVEVSGSVHRFPVRSIVQAPGMEQEAHEIARRILAHVAEGRQFREIGIIVRGRDPYVPILESALERYRIPARFYFSSPLKDSPVARYLAGALDALSSGWNHERLLPVLKMPLSGFGTSAACDRFDFEVREQLPSHGLSALRQLSDHPRLGALLDRLSGMEQWTGGRALPSDWAFRLKSLRCLVQNPLVSDGVGHEVAKFWRTQAHALEAFSAAVDEAAEVMPAKEPVSLAGFEDVLDVVLEHAELRVPDDRRNVVHVMDVYEARQWELPVVYVCGLIEKQFPRYHSSDSIFPDAARARLQIAGVRLRTSADLREEEQFLLEIATTRATSELVLTYPAYNEKGDPNLPSFYLESFGLEPEKSAPSAAAPAPRGPAVRDPYLRGTEVLETVRERNRVIRPRAVEAFLQCPFQFFLSHTLGVEPPPPLPRERLDARVEGEVVHQALSECQRTREPLDEVFERVFRAACERECVPAACRTELVRIRLLRDLRRFVEAGWLFEGWRSTTEETIEFNLDETTRVRGRIDRYDIHPDGRAVVFDYKYTREQGIRKRIRNYDEGRAVQGALYLLGLQQKYGFKPAGLFYWGLKKEVTLGGWHLSIPEIGTAATACTHEVLNEVLERARAATLAAAAEIRQGRVEPWPANRDDCDYCEYLDICRIGPPAEAVAAEGMAE